TARVVAVHVRVDEELDGLGADRLDGRDDLLAERRELTVHHQHAVRPGQHADVAALSFELIDVAAELGRLDFDFAEVLLLSVAGRRTHNSEAEDEQWVSEVLHRLAPSGTEILTEC